MNKKIKLITLIVFFILMAVFIKYLLGQNISSVEDYQKIVEQYGLFGPVVLTLFQAIQVIIPVLPGYLGCAVGALSFGTFVGFLCNYIGISLGSIIAFFLAEKYGEKIIVELFSTNMYSKWKSHIMKEKSYDRFLFIATLLPLFPDDFLCYFSGLIKMDKHRFIKIIFLGKPWCILAYSIVFGMIK